MAKYYEIFNQCYPQFAMDREKFDSLMLSEDSQIFDYYVNDEVVAFAIVEKYAIRLICVAVEYQRKGIGRELLTKSIEHIRSHGFDRVITGGVSSRFIIGADSLTWEFFASNGFRSVGSCDELLMRLGDYKYDPQHYHGHEQARYGWYSGDYATLAAAVASVEEDWVQYFDNIEKVYVGMVGDEIASFCLVDLDSQNYLSGINGRIGMPGCVGTVMKYRNRGIALEMIAQVTQYLKDSGMDTSFIYYTGVADWYKKIGYQIFMTEIFGELRLS